MDTLCEVLPIIGYFRSCQCTYCIEARQRMQTPQCNCLWNAEVRWNNCSRWFRIILPCDAEHNCICAEIGHQHDIYTDTICKATNHTDHSCADWKNTSVMALTQGRFSRNKFRMHKLAVYAYAYLGLSDCKYL